jgi:hypothetical protein
MHRIRKMLGTTVNKLIKCCIWTVDVCGSETLTLGVNEERVVNGFETWCWRRMLKIKLTGRITQWRTEGVSYYQGLVRLSWCPVADW